MRPSRPSHGEVRLGEEYLDTLWVIRQRRNSVSFSSPYLLRFWEEANISDVPVLTKEDLPVSQTRFEMGCLLTSFPS